VIISYYIKENYVINELICSPINVLYDFAEKPIISLSSLFSAVLCSQLHLSSRKKDSTIFFRYCEIKRDYNCTLLNLGPLPLILGCWAERKVEDLVLR
jgi:hypothetical protein